MKKRMLKSCPRCNRTFECRHDQITECECTLVPLNEEDMSYIHARHDECLCIDCLMALSRERKRKERHRVAVFQP